MQMIKMIPFKLTWIFPQIFLSMSLIPHICVGKYLISYKFSWFGRKKSSGAWKAVQNPLNGWKNIKLISPLSPCPWISKWKHMQKYWIAKSKQMQQYSRHFCRKTWKRNWRAILVCWEHEANQSNIILENGY